MADVSDAPEAVASKGKNVLTHKLGPLDLWQWLAATGGLLLAYLAYRRTAASTSTSATAVPSIASGNGVLASSSDSMTVSGQLQNIEGQLASISAQLPAAGTGGSTSSSAAPSTDAVAPPTAVQKLYATVGTSAGGIDPGGASFWDQRIGLEGINSVLAEIDNTAQGISYGNANPAAFVDAQIAALEPQNAGDTAGRAYWISQVQQVGAGQEAKAFSAAVTNAQKQGAK